mmetsp:Transcript_56624/g.130126  ORF Transcript_56624/g.130126 Transcript_56624/m.130126 type:complete len:315 (-) Transcript_56624:327-1271(-)
MVFCGVAQWASEVPAVDQIVACTEPIPTPATRRGLSARGIAVSHQVHQMLYMISQWKQVHSDDIRHLKIRSKFSQVSYQRMASTGDIQQMLETARGSHLTDVAVQPTPRWVDQQHIINIRSRTSLLPSHASVTLDYCDLVSNTVQHTILLGGIRKALVQLHGQNRPNSRAPCQRNGMRSKATIELQKPTTLWRPHLVLNRLESRAEPLASLLHGEDVRVCKSVQRLMVDHLTATQAHRVGEVVLSAAHPAAGSFRPTHNGEQVAVPSHVLRPTVPMLPLKCVFVIQVQHHLLLAPPSNKTARPQAGDTNAFAAP